jgi:hypothetical protein
VHENPESPPRLLERAKLVGDLEQDPYLSHRSESRSSVDEPGCPEWPFYGQYGAPVARVAAIHRLKAEKVFAAGAQGAPEERSHRSEGVSRLPAANP